MPELTEHGDVQFTLADADPEDWARATAQRSGVKHIDPPAPETPQEEGDAEQDVHTYFGLTYSTHAVLERTLMQSMPLDWQHAMTRLLRQMDEAYGHLATEYRVTSGAWVYVDDLSPTEMSDLGYSRVAMDGDQVVYDDGTDEVHSNSADRVFVPGPNPVPHYNRGRTHVQPRLPKSA